MVYKQTRQQFSASFTDAHTVIWIAIACLLFAALPALLYFANVKKFKPPPPIDIQPGDELPKISVLIPARNEERSIEACVNSILANQHVNVEVIVLDDQSTDQTAMIVARLSRVDQRVQLAQSPALPSGWCGKQHACYSLSKLAKYNLLTFLDADVRLQPLALARMAAFQQQSNAELVSGFPRQVTGTFLEKLLIPLIHWLLLGFLPFSQMRTSRQAGLGAGCGQWFFTTRKAYESMGGHSAVKESLHDGVKLPRAYRKAGFMTDLCDVTDLATCRMYHNAGQVWLGLAKNAREGLGSPNLLPFFTLIFTLGQILPLILIGFCAWNTIAFWLLALSILALYLPRLHAVLHFKQSLLSAILHPLGIATLLLLQWYANAMTWLGRPVGWKGRVHPTIEQQARPA